ncbi:hypothetical protein K2X30_14215 [bacterium]|nr:hypothetical protein [bacterium]
MNRYIEEGAIVFSGLDYFMIWIYLMTKRYDRLALHYCDLSGAQHSRAELINLLQMRTRKLGLLNGSLTQKVKPEV